MQVRKAFRFYPTPEQVARFGQRENALRFLWNLALEQRLMGLRRTDKRYPTAFDQRKELTELRAELPWLADVPRNVCAQLLVELDKAWQRSLKRLARAQRVVARRKKGSKNREKAKARVAVLHRKVRRQREHLLHTLSAAYTKSHGTVVVEKLEILNMTRSAKGTVEEPGTNVAQKAGLNRGILGAGWGRFAEQLRYKLAWSGGSLVEVPAAYSSQTCSACGHIAAQNRPSQAVFCCVSCGYQDHADLNAAKNLLARANRSGLPGEGSPLGTRRTRKVSLRVPRRAQSPGL
jgi:putative transposase